MYADNCKIDGIKNFASSPGFEITINISLLKIFYSSRLIEEAFLIAMYSKDKGITTKIINFRKYKLNREVC